MGVYGYDWEPYEITTDDGYTLTLMNVTKKRSAHKANAPLNPLLMVPAMGSNPDSWLSVAIYNDPPDNAIQLKLLDEGHDLWGLYSRGSEYSRVHDKYDVHTAEFWNFSWHEMGYYDLKAAVDFIYQKKQQKVAMFGYSMGTTQIFAALASEYDFFKDKVFKVIQQAPCTITAESMFGSFNAASREAARLLGIFEVGGPNWYEEVGKLSKTIGLKNTQGILDIGWGSRLTNIPFKAFDHYAQNAKSDRFQLYSDSYWTPVIGKKKTDLYDLSVITETPIGMFMGAIDDSCLPE